MIQASHTWQHVGVIAQWVVAVIALGGYGLSYWLNYRQEKHKYRAALVATFPLPTEEARKGDRMVGWIPGFALLREGTDEALQADFVLENISESPVADVRMNFYLHDCSQFDKEPGIPECFFENDVPLVDGIAKNAQAPFARILRSRSIREWDEPAVHRAASGGRVRKFDFSRFFLSLIPSERPDEPARWSTSTVVLKYKNLQGEPFFSAYKLEGPVEHAQTLLLDEYFRMVFLGSFSGDYLTDDGCHQFVANRGFPDAKRAPDWDGVRATIEEAARMVANFRSGIETEAQGKSSG